jgi:hypothetical protein
MKIAIISEDDFGFSKGLERTNHDVSLYGCSSINDLCRDVSGGYRPDCIFLMEDGRVPPAFWDKNNIESHFDFSPTLVYFTRECLEPTDSDLKKIGSSDLVLTQNMHLISDLAFNDVNVFRFPYWADTSVFFSTDSPKTYDCVSSTSNLEVANKFESALSSKGLSFLNKPICDPDFLNSGKVFLNFEEKVVVPRAFFEASACGLPILSSHLNECSVIESLLEEEREILYFSSLDECVSRAYLYARHERERRVVARKSFYLIEKYHTIEKRVRKFIKEIKILKL